MAFWLVAMWVGALPVKEQVQRVETAYGNYKFKEAAQLAEGLLADPALQDPTTRQRTREVRAFSLFLSDQEAGASEELGKLFRENANYAIDREKLHPDVVRFFDAEHAKFVASLPKETQPQPSETQPSGPQTLGDRHLWLRIFPLGIGHFCNHDFLAGGLFLGGEVALVALNLTAFGVRESFKASDGLFRARTNPGAWQVVQVVSGIAAYTLIVIEVIDAFVWSPDRGRRSLAESMKADLGPLGEWRFALAP